MQRASEKTILILLISAIKCVRASSISAIMGFLAFDNACRPSLSLRNDQVIVSFAVSLDRAPECSDSLVEFAFIRV